MISSRLPIACAENSCSFSMVSSEIITENNGNNNNNKQEKKRNYNKIFFLPHPKNTLTIEAERMSVKYIHFNI